MPRSPCASGRPRPAPRRGRPSRGRARAGRRSRTRRTSATAQRSASARTAQPGPIRPARRRRRTPRPGGPCGRAPRSRRTSPARSSARRQGTYLLQLSGVAGPTSRPVMVIARTAALSSSTLSRRMSQRVGVDPQAVDAVRHRARELELLARQRRVIDVGPAARDALDPVARALAVAVAVAPRRERPQAPARCPAGRS